VIFASFEFLFLFLPAFFAVYFLAPRGARNFVILAFSWAFYGWWRYDFLALLVGISIFSFAMALWVERLEGAARTRVMVLATIGNLGCLGYFKYANFGVATYNEAMAALGMAPLPWAEILLPIGLSFYVLQSLSYVIDVYWRDVRASRSFVAYSAYLSMFSQLIAGPIVRYSEVDRELKQREHSWPLFGAGARRFMCGFAMKVVIADTLSPIVEASFALPAPTLADAWLGATAYTLQLFFDFAGYSAMAIGLGLMMGFRFPENFNWPYLAGSIQEFWQRWHMTLSRFLRDYLYIPLGGNRKGPVRTYVNLLLTMVIGGFWHGANWTFIVWGAWHGGLLALHRLFKQAGGAVPYAVGLPVTLLCVVIGWVVFRAETMGQAMAMYRGMLGLNGTPMSDMLAWQVLPDHWWALGAGIALCAMAGMGSWLPWQREPGAIRGIWRLGWQWGPSLAFLFAVVMLYSRAAVPFLYFQF